MSEEAKDYLRSALGPLSRWLPHIDHFVVPRRVVEAARELAEELANVSDLAPRPGKCLLRFSLVCGSNCPFVLIIQSRAWRL